MAFSADTCLINGRHRDCLRLFPLHNVMIDRPAPAFAQAPSTNLAESRKHFPWPIDPYTPLRRSQFEHIIAFYGSSKPICFKSKPHHFRPEAAGNHIFRPHPSAIVWQVISPADQRRNVLAARVSAATARPRPAEMLIDQMYPRHQSCWPGQVQERAAISHDGFRTLPNREPLTSAIYVPPT